MTARFVAAALAASVCAPALAQPGGADVVPSTAFAFVTVKLSDAWDAPALKPVRDVFSQGELGLVREHRRVWGLGPAEIDRFTLLWPAMPSGPGTEEPLVLVSTRKPFNEAALLKALRAVPATEFRGRGGRKAVTPAATVEKTVEKKEPVPPPVSKCGEEAEEQPAGKEEPPARAAELYALEGHGFGAVYLLDDRSLLFLPGRALSGGEPQVLALLGQLLRRKADGPLAEALAEAGKHTLVAGLQVSQFERALEREGGGVPAEVVPFRSLLKARALTLTADVAEEAKVTARLTFADAADARRAEPVLKTLFQTLSELLANARKGAEKDEYLAGVLVPLMDVAAKALDGADVKADGAAVTASMRAEVGPVVAKAMAGAPKAIEAAAGRTKTQNNLKQIGLACHNFESVNGYFPTDITDPQTGKPILSWRVAILPYIEQQNLYQQMNLQQPWDSPQNKKFLEQMPQQFRVYGREPKEKGYTFLQMPSAAMPIPGGSPFKVAGLKRKIFSITDGTSNTLMVVEAADAVPWTKPDDVAFDPKNLPKLGDPRRNRFQALFADGSVREFKPDKLSDDVLRALLTTDGGEVIPNLDDR